MTCVRWSEEDLTRFNQRTGAAPPAPIAAVPDARGNRRMNKLEAAYALELDMRRLAREIKAWRFEAIKLRLAEGAFFKPDFTVVGIGGEIEMHEIKGFWREAARVRIKVAAEQFPWFRFIALRRLRKREGGGWKIEEF